MYELHDDTALLSLLQQDNPGAFQAIYKRYFHKLLAVAYNRLHNLQNCEDILHDVFASLWMNRHRYQVNSLENYLATAIKFRCYDFLEKAGRTVLPSDDFLPEPAADDNTLQLLESRLLQQALLEETNRLPEKCRLVFEASRGEGLSNREIAEKYNISLSAVENHLNKALKRLRQALKPVTACFLFAPAVFFRG
jgi:RNA polymerase sigma-70 factor (ECF subfamily)